MDDIIEEWGRVLKPGGTLEIRCPYLRIRALLFFLDPGYQNVENIYGKQNHEWNFHKQGFSYGLLKDMLTNHGIEEVEIILDGYKGIPFLPADLHVEGTKTVRM